MKIINVEAFYLRLPDIQQRTDSSQDALLVKITTDAGIVGWGEVDGSPAVTQAIIEAPYSHTMVTGLKSLLIGENPLDTNRLWAKMYHLLWSQRRRDPGNGWHRHCLVGREG